MKFFAVLCFLYFAVSSQARKTNFEENHSGFFFSAGAYPSGAEGSDPLSQMVPAGTTVNGGSGRLLPVKGGFFFDRGPASLELYYKYLSNASSTWNTSGGFSGDGSTDYRSSGFGAKVVASFIHAPRFKLGVLLQGEYVNQKVKHKFNGSGEDIQKLGMAHTTMTFGSGLQADFWLGDLWALSTNASYNYGMSSAWKATREDQFLHAHWPQGAVLNRQTAEPVKASFSGIIIELGLKLNFF